jgi:hypothetical protein
MRFVCRICSQEFTEIPSNAIPVGSQKYGHLLYMFPDEVIVHDLKIIKEEIPEVHKEK